MSVEGIFTAIIAGIIIGALARLVIPGRQNIGIIVTILIGIVGAFLGGFIAAAVGVTSWILVLLFQVAVAAIGVALIGGVGRRRTTV